MRVRGQERDRGGGGKGREKERDSWQINFYYYNSFSNSVVTYEKQKNAILAISRFHLCLVIP